MLTAIMASNRRGVVGIDTPAGPALPWRLKPDMKRFRELTTGHAVIMGRKTYESIGKPLPNRKNIVLSTTHPTLYEHLSQGDLFWASSPEHAYDLATMLDPDPFLIGGPACWSALWDRVTKVERTIVEIDIAVGCHVFDFHVPYWAKASETEEMLDEESCLHYRYQTWLRVRRDDGTKIEMFRSSMQSASRCRHCAAALPEGHDTCANCADERGP